MINRQSDLDWQVDVKWGEEKPEPYFTELQVWWNSSTRWGTPPGICFNQRALYPVTLPRLQSTVAVSPVLSVTTEGCCVTTVTALTPGGESTAESREPWEMNNGRWRPTGHEAKAAARQPPPYMWGQRGESRESPACCQCGAGRSLAVQLRGEQGYSVRRGGEARQPLAYKHTQTEEGRSFHHTLWLLSLLVFNGVDGVWRPTKFPSPGINKGNQSINVLRMQHHVMCCTQPSFLRCTWTWVGNRSKVRIVLLGLSMFPWLLIMMIIDYFVAVGLQWFQTCNLTCLWSVECWESPLVIAR